MARSKRFFSGLISGYAAIGVNVLYTMGSIPLALHYLTKEGFGIWVLITQIVGYLTILELGLSVSIARFLADHKDDVADGTYGSVIKTGNWVFLFQGMLVALCGVVLAFISPGFLHIPPDLQQIFSYLLAFQALIAGGHIATRTVGSLLWCHQRHDIIGIAGIVDLSCNFAVLWIGFSLGWKFYSLMAASLVSFVVSLAISIYAARRCGYYPPDELKGKFDRNIFRQLFHFGSGLFVMNIGAQLASASQVVIVTRMMGLEAASIWAIGTKVASLAQTVVGRIFESSSPALAEMLVRKEDVRLKKRFQDISVLSSVLALAATAGIAFLNKPFLEIWTSSRIAWDPINDLLLGILVFVTTFSRCHVGILTMEKNIRGLKYISLLEGLAFIATATIAAKFFGYPGILVAAIACNLFITGLYALAKSRNYLPESRTIHHFDSFRHLCIVAIIVVLFAGVHSFLGSDPTWLTQVVVASCLLVGAVFPLLWKFGLNENARKEIKSIAGFPLRF